MYFPFSHLRCSDMWLCVASWNDDGLDCRWVSAGVVVQSMAVMGWLCLQSLASGSSVVWIVTSPGRRSGKDGSRSSSSFLQQFVLVMKDA